MPKLITTCAEINQTACELRRTGQRIGLIPTMGALHEGHLTLVRQAKAECDLAIATIFVNPTQFAPHEDFAKYPRTLEADLALLESARCDFVFAPTKEEMYATGFSTYIQPPKVALPLESVCRPDHFRGVCTVVLKLLNAVPSDIAYFGQKDFQQALVIRHMVRDLNVSTAIEVCPIVRESDGLAMSSRNRYLSTAERTQALAISRALHAALQQFGSGIRSGSQIAARMRESLHENGIDRIDYAVVADANTLDELDIIDRPAVVLIACHVGTTRLIDNVLLKGE